jgi:ubiquinone/menaquinone biosynthesis C-methylase UbiE
MLEIGAGSGIFAEYLKSIVTIGKIYGLDIYQQAKTAAYRERHGLYSGYYVTDLTNLSTEILAELSGQRFNCVGVASATGWGNHIPVEGFEQAFQLLEPNGWFVFHVKPNDPDEECVKLNHWINRKVENEKIVLIERKSCFHRYSISGESIYYDVIVGVKNGN